MPAELAQAEVADGGDAITLLELCDRCQLSRSTFYEMRKHGIAPREIHIGRRVLVERNAIRESEELMADGWSAEQLLADELKRTGMRRR